MNKLYYIGDGNIREAPATPERLRAVGIYWHDTRRDALIALKAVIAERVQKDVDRLVELEKEISGL